MLTLETGGYGTRQKHGTSLFVLDKSSSSQEPAKLTDNLKLYKITDKQQYVVYALCHVCRMPLTINLSLTSFVCQTSFVPIAAVNFV